MPDIAHRTSYIVHAQLTMITIQPIHKYDCDVLISGGGPAGSSMAFYLAEKGIKVMVAESQKFPRDKICGDGVSPIALAELQRLGITGSEEFLKVNEVNKVGLFIAGQKVMIELPKPDHLPFRARIVPRLQLDNWIYEAAKKKGVVFLEDTRLGNYIIDENVVTAEVKQGRETKKIKAKIIVGADGSSSTVARIFNGAKPLEEFQLLGLRAYYEGVNGPQDRVDIFFSEENFPGIYWMFPMGENAANIGLAMVAKTLPKNKNHVNELLNNHIKNNKDIAERIGTGSIKGKISGWPLTFYNPKNKISGNRLLLTGDAAGLINPLSGDGIQYALLSARWAAECIINCAEKNDFSSVATDIYTKKIKEELAYDFALSNLLIQFGRNKTFKPVWMEIMAVLIERAKVDKDYADIIAGIFEGTLPSYKALNPKFIFNSLLQGGIHVGVNTMEGILNGPEYWKRKGKDTGHLAKNIIQSIRQNPSGHAKWLAGVAQKGLAVGGHLIKNMRKQNNKIA